MSKLLYSATMSSDGFIAALKPLGTTQGPLRRTPGYGSCGEERYPPSPELPSPAGDGSRTTATRPW